MKYWIKINIRDENNFLIEIVCELILCVLRFNQCYYLFVVCVGLSDTKLRNSDFKLRIKSDYGHMSFRSIAPIYYGFKLYILDF